MEYTEIMGYVIFKFQNLPEYPDVEIDENDPGWDKDLQLWRDGKNPTDSKFWKKGVIAKTILRKDKG